MSSILNKQIVLKLNANWQAVGFVTIKEAITFLCSENGGQHPGFAMDYETITDEDGNTSLNYANPVCWEDWIKLPVREKDLAINTGRGQIRAPLVVVCANYNKVPTRTTRWSAGNVHKRDGYTCAYTGEKLSNSTMTIDHIVPRSRGGKDTWENTVSCHRKVNTLKANRTPREAGLTLRIVPKAPPVLPVVITTKDACHESQKPFLL